MSEEPYNPNDEAFLFSRSLDEELTEPERTRLEQALAASEPLRDQTRQLRAVDQLVRRLGSESVELDWESFTALTQARAQSEPESLGKVDRLLDRWAEQEVAFDEEDYTATVMARIKGTNARPSRRRLIFRLAAPLAAAAAVALALTNGFWLASPTQFANSVVIGPARPMLVEPNHPPKGTVVVAFDRTPVDLDSDENTPGVSFGSVGSGSDIRFGHRNPPL